MTELAPKPPRAAALRTAVEKTLTAWPLTHIRPDPNQPRRTFDEKGLTELSQSLAATGQQAPVIGYPDPADPQFLVLVDGERRYRAGLRVPLAHLDAVVLPGPPDPVSLLVTQLCLGQFQEKLSGPELADAYDRIMTKFGLSQKELAERLGKSEASVSNAFALRRLAPALRERARDLEPSVAAAIARLSVEEHEPVLTFALALSADGKRPSRAEVQAFATARKPSRSGRAKAFRGRLDGRDFRIDLLPDDTHAAIADFLRGLLAVVKRYESVPVSNLNAIAGG